MSIIATDIFFCLFGVFAVLREIAPHYEFSSPVFQAILIEWSSPAAKYCVLRAEIEDGTSPKELLHDEEFTITSYSQSERKCRFYKKIDTNSIGAAIKVYALIPVRDQQDIKVSFGDSAGQCQNCSDASKAQMIFEVIRL